MAPAPDCPKAGGRGLAELLTSAAPSDIEAGLQDLIATAPTLESANGWRRALRAMFQQPTGRPPRYAARDERDLAEADRLLAAGLARSFHGACQMIARKYPGDERSVQAAVKRLAKRRASKKSSA